MDTVILIAAVCLMGIAAVWDIRTREIPNWVPMGLLILSGMRIWCGSYRWRGAVVGLVIWGALSVIAYFLSSRGGKEPGIGAGDIKLMCALSAFTGFMGFPAVLLGSCAAGLPLYPLLRSRRIPFAPCLTAGLSFWLLFAA
ncbi:MAG: A24 family peptidase [Oscillospiraceae bacterium]|nr:A24 family peptidase [Oscillospiraceae bacterium]